MKTIQYYTKNVYGKEMIYLADEMDACLWFDLTGKKTIAEREMPYLTRLTGAQFERVFEPANV